MDNPIGQSLGQGLSLIRISLVKNTKVIQDLKHDS